MTDVLPMLVPGLGGVGLGVFFFGGLWWTVRRGIRSRHAALWFTGSLLVRAGAALAGIYWLAAGRWERMLACIAGFFIARLLVTRFAGPPLAARRPAAAEEDVHAS